MLHHDSDVKTYKNIANKSICLVTAVSMVGVFGGYIPQAPYAYADEGQTEIKSDKALIAEPYAIILELINVRTDSVVTRDEVLAFLADHNIDQKGFESITPAHMASFESGFTEEICRLQALLKPSTSVDPGTSSDAPSSQPSNPSGNPSDNPSDKIDVPDSSSASDDPSTSVNNPVPSWEAEEAAILPMITEDGSNSGDIAYPQWSYSGNTSFSVNPQASISDSALVALLGENMRDICQEKGLYASVILAQVILDANAYDCEFAPFQNKVFFLSDEAPEADELSKLNEGYDISKRFKNRFENYSDMVDYLEGYADFLSGDMPYTNYQLVAAQNLYREALRAQADMADAESSSEHVDGRSDSDVIDASSKGDVVRSEDVDAIFFSSSDIKVTPRETAGMDGNDAAYAGTAGIATSNAGTAGITISDAGTADAGAVGSDAAMAEAPETYADNPQVPESLVLTQEQIDIAYSDMLDSIPSSYQEACFWLEQTFDCDEGYAVSLLETIDRYDLTRYDQMRSYRLENSIEMPVKDDDGNVLYDELTHEPVMHEVTLVDLMDEVISHLGEPYVWGGTTPGAFDCSGLVQYAYSKALGVSIPRTTYYQCLQGQDVDFEDLQMGDLVFFANSKGVCTHVGIYLGEDCYIEAPHTGDVVKVTSMAGKTPTFAKRILATEDVTYTFSLGDDETDFDDVSDGVADLQDDGMQDSGVRSDAAQSSGNSASDLSEVNDLSTLFDLILKKLGFEGINTGSFVTYKTN